MPLSPSRDVGKRTAANNQAAELGSFEAAHRELQQIVEQLESAGLAGLDLDRAVGLFERGTQLVGICERIVESAELRVTRLTAEVATPLSEVPGDC